jgi:hypothetical protein
MLSGLFRSFSPLENPLGFGVDDYLFLALAVLLLAGVVLWRPLLRTRTERLAPRTALSMALLVGLVILLRVLLLPRFPVPVPGVYDEFSHLLAADTLLHFRLANPAHPLHQFFETFFVLQQPTYSSIYPLGQGLLLAVGRLLGGVPWTSIVFCTAALPALVYWMLRAWTTPGWALLGGFLALFEFGPLSQWMNSYWGGSLTAVAGCLVFGALPRLCRQWRLRDGLLLGVGLGVHLLTRPFESMFLLCSVVLFFIPALRQRDVRQRLYRPAIATLLAVLPAIALTLLQNRQVTGSWTTLPYQLSQYQYGVPSALTIQKNPIPHNSLTPQQVLDYRMQTLAHGPGHDTISKFFLRLAYRMRFCRFFFLPALYVAVPFFLWALRERRFWWVGITIALFALGTNLFPYFQFHYVAALTSLFVLVSVTGLQKLSQIKIRTQPVGADAAFLLVCLCVLHFGLWYGLNLFGHAEVALTLRSFETWDSIGDIRGQRRAEIADQLGKMPGQQLVFVRYSPHHVFQDEWVWNSADIDDAKVVWARDLGPQEDENLRRYYPNRRVWLIEPDLQPSALTPY